MKQYVPIIMTKTIGVYKTLNNPQPSFPKIKEFFIENNYITANTKILVQKPFYPIVKISLYNYFGKDWANIIQQFSSDTWYDIFGGKYWYKKGWNEE